MKADELVAIRHRWGLTQEELARRIGIGRRAYITLEMGERSIRQTHILALERISVDICIERNDRTFLLSNIRYAIDFLSEDEEKI